MKVEQMRISPMVSFFPRPDIYPPVTEELLAEIVRRIRTVGSPLKILLFGSRACGNHRPDSDIDIFILEKNNVDRRKKSRIYDQALYGVYPEYTVIVRSLDDVEQWKYVPNQLETEALSQGKVLYEDVEQMLALSDGTGLVREGFVYKTPSDMARNFIEKANSDLHSAKLILESDGPYDTACFHAQQAVEKHMKALLALHGAHIEKTHDLKELTKLCLSLVFIPELANFNFKRMTEYAVELRYEGGFWPDRHEGREALALAEKAIEIIRKHLPPEALPSL